MDVRTDGWTDGERDTYLSTCFSVLMCGSVLCGFSVLMCESVLSSCMVMCGYAWSYMVMCCYVRSYMVNGNVGSCKVIWSSKLSNTYLFTFFCAYI